MVNDKKEFKELFDNEEEYNDYIAFVERADKIQLEFYKRQKRMRIFGFVMIGFIISLLVVAILSFLYPSLEKVWDSYFLLCNFISIGLCTWSFLTLFKLKKGKNIKDMSLNWFIAFSIFALLLNIAIVLNDLFFHLI